VPLIAWCPSRYRGGRVVERPVSLVDITPTLLEIAGAPVPPGLDGISLEAALAGRSQQFRDATVSEVSRALVKEPGVLRAVRTEREKLIALPHRARAT
jgi:arylsulfatase A-like enzyme